MILVDERRAPAAAQHGFGRALLALLAMIATLFAGISPAMARGGLQCVPYARSVSGIDLQGNAFAWWDHAAGAYDRGQRPEVGSVLAFRATSAMPYGHVAVVAKVLDDRRLLLDHANWSGHGQIDRNALVEDVSAAGDWSAVRVWYTPTHSLGLRVAPTYGFIYPHKSQGGFPAAADTLALNMTPTSYDAPAGADAESAR